MNEVPEPSEGPRRNFLLEFWAVVVGGLTGLVPLVTGMFVPI